MHGFKTLGMGLTWIVVKDFQAAVDFYTTVMGLQKVSCEPQYCWAELSGPQGEMFGIAGECDSMDMKAGSNGVATILVDDIEAAKKWCHKQGVVLVGETLEVPGHVKMQSFKDPSGNTLQIVEKLS